jgi:UDPglucose--hexose-1-phosphate uridylyltransferase
MPELRYNPMLDTWTMVATNRQNRPHLSADYCAFCPGEGKSVPAKYDVFAYTNDFPVLSQKPDGVDKKRTNKIFVAAEAYGKCEVILYSSEHTKKIYELSDAHVLKIVELWTERYRELSKDPKIKYIFEFENRGEEVGVTMLHPHGQIYAYSWMPEKVRSELNNCKKYFKKHGSNLFKDMNAAEKKYKKRVVIENKSFVAYIPYFTDYPFGLFIVNKKLKQNFTEFTLAEKKDLAEMLKKVVRGFDKVYDRPFPYIMAIHQSPVNSPAYKDCADYFAFHIEFYPPLRGKDKIKWYAGSEMGAGAAANPLDVDECAAILREKIK